MPIPDSAREVILSGALAHLVTLNSDGSPQVTCVWTGIEDDEIVVGHLRYHRKLKNIGRDARVAISWETDRENGFGLTEYLVAYGTARITEGGAPQLLQELASVYLGPAVRFPAMPDPPPGWVMRIRPERFAGVGPWASPD
jgi:PPOX class probable F420-dependent enzyme